MKTAISAVFSLSMCATAMASDQVVDRCSTFADDAKFAAELRDEGKSKFDIIEMSREAGIDGRRMASFMLMVDQAFNMSNASPDDIYADAFSGCLSWHYE